MSLGPLKIQCKLAKTPVDSPKYSVPVKNLDGTESQVGDPKVTRALVALMNQHAVIGGAAAHWGGPAAFAEIMSSIHGIMFKDKSKSWFEEFNFVNDAGHCENGVYALRANYGFDGLNFDDLRKFRSIESKLTGHGEAHLNPEGVFVSNGPLGSGLPQAQGLAMADSLIGNDRLTVCTISDGASMEGEAKESFAALPGLAQKGKLNPFVMVISDNNTKLSGRIDQDSFSMAPTFESLSILGWEVVKVENGHDIQSTHTAIEKAMETARKNPSKPVAVWTKTIKGYGVKSTEEAASGGHGYPLKAYDDKLPAFIDEIFGSDTPNEFSQWSKDVVNSKPEAKANTSSSDVINEKVQPGFSRAAIRATKEGLPVFSLSSDLQGSTGIAAFQKECTDNYYDLGVAESNMVSTGVGLSKQGLIPIVDTFAQFGITKGNLPLIMSTLSEGPVIALFSHTGFQDAADGASHQATTFMAATAAIPHTTIVNCTCSAEAESLMYQAITRFKDAKEKGKMPDTVCFFFGRENHPQYFIKDCDYKWGKAQIIEEGSDVTIVATGPMLPKALAAAEKLKENGKSATVINNSFVNRPDTETISAALKKTGNKLITIEDHQLIGGMGSLLIQALKLEGHEFNVKSLANSGKFGQSAYKADHLYDLYGLSADGILQALKDLD
ncbi:MAG: transketolase [Bacteriovoracaceae bacterium]|nr:transketolase [Bacteriovoracaceae bacterium]